MNIEEYALSNNDYFLKRLRNGLEYLNTSLRNKYILKSNLYRSLKGKVFVNISELAKEFDVDCNTMWNQLTCIPFLTQINYDTFTNGYENASAEFDTISAIIYCICDKEQFTTLQVINETNLTKKEVNKVLQIMCNRIDTIQRKNTKKAVWQKKSIQH